VRLIIADTGPINYLVLIGSIDLLPILFENVILQFGAGREHESGFRHRCFPFIESFHRTMVELTAWRLVYGVPWRAPQSRPCDHP
jgi:predicted nucleic acid-binding protein